MFAVGASAAEVTQRLQAERAAAVGVLLPGSEVVSADFERAVQRTDEAITWFRGLRGELGGSPGDVRAVLARADAGLADVQAQRQWVRGDGPVGVCQTNGVTRVVEGYLRFAVRRPSKAISKAFRAGFQRMVHRRRPCPVGSRLITAR
ncbi:nitrate- and nitrite sensing domain-containing protein [Micromonospora sp. HUAS LYJ1]|nr:nitrate- and nitrite sensing domain-containing protein [Micromonospora sp. HUAS LYJ1]WKU08664.1 nitrate- and nitrite sensing domain-containing protein [Micromonospora sp. HUAS LYJ1]